MSLSYRNEKCCEFDNDCDIIMALYKRYVQFRYLHTHFLALEKSIRASAL